IMDDPNITMEEYIRLQEEKYQRAGRTFNWQTATYGKVKYYEDEDECFTNFESKFPAIVFDDTSDATLSCEPTVSPLNDNKIDFRISFDESDDEDYTVIYDVNSFSYKIIYVNDLKTDSKNDNDKGNMPLFLTPEPEVSYSNDLEFFKNFENEFPAIVYNDALTSKSDFLTEPTIFLRQLGTLTPLNVSNLFHKRLNEMDAFEMIRAVSDKEIKDAVFSMGNDKSPGPDCFTADFFKEAWDIVATHVISSIYDLFLFAHGDANSASVIMSALDEFKQQIMRGFLWCHGSLSRGKAKVAWEIVCLPKVEGGLGKYLMLSSIPDPITVPSTRDVLEWCDSYGTAKEFSLKTVWGSIRPRSNKVVWCHAVWFPECIPRHAFHLWLVIKRRLKTHDRLRAWDHVWYEMKGFASLPNSSSSNDAILNDIYPFAMKKTSRSVIAKLVLAAMPPKRTSTSEAPAMTQAAITTALEAQAATMANADNTNKRGNNGKY
ncbi:hypothetical protein Tco_1438926, partial [Tanacetum coccineum]